MRIIISVGIVKYMYRVLYQVYIKCLEQDSKGVWRRMYCSFFFYFCNFLYKYYLKWSKGGSLIKNKMTESRLIISLTSYPGRIHYIWITIETLLRQTVKPDMIILWLAEDQFPNKKLPFELEKLKERGLTIRWCDNLMSHKKYFYVMQEYPNANVITADDDSFYPPFFVERLVNMHKTFPEDVVCLTAQSMGETYRCVPSQWPGISKEEITSSYSLSINSGSGALFPPQSLSYKAFDKIAIRSVCPYADDLWLTVMTHINGRKITKYKYHPFPVIIKETMLESLCRTYNGPQAQSEMNNDRQWTNIMTKYAADIKAIVGECF